MKDNHKTMEEIFSKEELHILKEGNTTVEVELHIHKVGNTIIDNLTKGGLQMLQMKDVISLQSPQR
uniref:Uncharacterized protein n=1 Tax=Nymphaea colorata TaxID=210225 RepID=A0A5K1FNI9_9MAGN